MTNFQRFTFSVGTNVGQVLQTGRGSWKAVTD